MKNKEKGASLVVVIVVMAVMMILGICILDISLSQTLQAAQEDKRIQAHYLARSGAEATLSAWQSASADSKPNGVCNTVYLNSSNQFVSTRPSSFIGKFDVNISNPASNTTLISSQGTVMNVSQTVMVKIKTVTTQVTKTQNPKVSGATINWYDSNSGEASAGSHNIGASGITFMVYYPGLKITHGAVLYQADSIDFSADIKNFKYPLTLNSGTVIFETPLNINRNGNNDGKIILEVLVGTGVARAGYLGEWGRVEYNGQWYYYNNSTLPILNPSDFSNLAPIASSDANYPGDATQTITSYSILWSDK